jgi:hypothetical protein
MRELSFIGSSTAQDSVLFVAICILEFFKERPAICSKHGIVAQASNLPCSLAEGCSDASLRSDISPVEVANLQFKHPIEQLPVRRRFITKSEQSFDCRQSYFIVNLSPVNFPFPIWQKAGPVLMVFYSDAVLFRKILSIRLWECSCKRFQCITTGCP